MLGLTRRMMIKKIISIALAAMLFVMPICQAWGSETTSIDSYPPGIQGDGIDANQSLEDEKDSSETQQDPQQTQDEFDQLGVNSAQDTEASEEEIGSLESNDTTHSIAGTYVIRTALSLTHVLDIPNGSMQSSANIQLWSSNMSGAQQYVISDLDENGYCTITNVNSGMLLDVAGGKPIKGSNVWQYVSNDSAAQKWLPVAHENGSYSFISALDPNLVLDVSGGKGFSGANINVYIKNGTRAQQFFLLPVKPSVPVSNVDLSGVYTIASNIDTAFTIDVSGASTANGTQLQLWGSNNTFAQFFEFTPYDGYYKIKNINSGKFLAAQRGNLVPTTPVIQWDESEDANNHLWSIHANGDGSYTFFAKTSGLALDVAGGRAVKGALMNLYLPNETAAQAFRLTHISSSELQEGVYNIRSTIDSSKVVDIQGGSRDVGAVTNLYTLNGTPAQKYQIKKSGEGYTVQVLGSGYFLTACGAQVQQMPASQNTDQTWLIELAIGGYRLTNVATKTVLDISGAGNYNGCPIGLYQSNGTRAQRFNLTLTAPLSSNTYEIRSSVDDKAVDVERGSCDIGANVRIYRANSSGAQKWKVTELGNGYLSIINLRSKKALDISGASTSPGANVQQYNNNGSAAQQFKAIPSGDGYYYLQSLCGGQYLTIDSSNSNIMMDTLKSTEYQKFYFKHSSYSVSGNSWLDGQLEYITAVNGNNLASCFNYVASYPYATMSLYPSGAWATPFAIEMIQGGRGNCYRYAALFCMLARQLGYDASVISGWVPLNSGGLSPHGWCEILINGITYVFDPTMAHSIPGRNWYMTTYSNAPITYVK